MSLLDAIGNTPLVQVPGSPDRGEIWVKLEVQGSDGAGHGPGRGLKYLAGDLYR